MSALQWCTPAQKITYYERWLNIIVKLVESLATSRLDLNSNKPLLTGRLSSTFHRRTIEQVVLVVSLVKIRGPEVSLDLETWLTSVVYRRVLLYQTESQPTCFHWSRAISHGRSHVQSHEGIVRLDSHHVMTLPSVWTTQLHLLHWRIQICLLRSRWQARTNNVGIKCHQRTQPLMRSIIKYKFLICSLFCFHDWRKQPPGSCRLYTFADRVYDPSRSQNAVVWVCSMSCALLAL